MVKCKNWLQMNYDGTTKVFEYKSDSWYYSPTHILPMKHVYNFHNSFLLSLIYLLDSYLNHRAPLEYQTKCCCLEWLQLGVPNLLEYFSNQRDWVPAGYATNLSSPLHLKGLHFHFNKLQFIKKPKNRKHTYIIKIYVLFLDSCNLSCTRAMFVWVEGNKKNIKIYT